MLRDAVISPCGNYRYALWREWDSSKKRICWIGLNPSRADDKIDDPTMKRCISYSIQWGYGSMAVGNLFAWRTPNPRNLLDAADPVGPDNDFWLQKLAADAEIVVAFWGTGGILLNRAEQIRELLPELHCLKLTKSGQPHHTRGLPNELKPVLFQAQKR